MLHLLQVARAVAQACSIVQPSEAQRTHRCLHFNVAKQYTLLLPLRKMSLTITIKHRKHSRQTGRPTL